MIDRLAEVSGRTSMLARLKDVLRADISRETYERLERFTALLRAEAIQQNLVSRSTLDDVWDRHILDSAQLARFEPAEDASWVDIGSGAGLPGIVIASLVRGPVVLVEPRRLRAQFLERAVTELGFEQRVSIAPTNVQRVRGRFDMITARAVAPLDRLLAISTHLSTRKTIWVLPKGRNAQSELAEARRNWHCEATSVPSRTDPESEILVLRDVKSRGGR